MTIEVEEQAEWVNFLHKRNESHAYNPDQPRAPKGSSVGGQWVDADGSGSGHDTPEESDIEHRSGEEHHESLNAAAHKWIEEHADAPWDENKLVDYVKFINSRPEVPALVQDLEANADPHPAIQIGSFGPDVPVTYLLGWGKSGATPIHDHADSKVGIIVHKGTVEEEIFVPAGKGVKLLDADGSSTNAARVHRSASTGQVTKWKGAHIHRVFNDSDQYAVTVHSYYPPLSKMGFYEYSEETTEGISSGKLTLTGKWEDDNIRKPPPVKASRRCPCTWAYNPDQPRAPKGTPTGGQWVDDPDVPGQGEFPLGDKRGALPKRDDAEKALSQKEIADLLEQHTDSDPLTEDDLLNPGESVHKVYFVKTEDDRQWIVKPVTGDERQPSGPGLGRAIEDYGTHKREVAGSEIAEMVGMGDMVPKVAMGEVTVATGDDPDDPDDLEPVDATIAEFVPKARTGARAYKPAIPEDQERAAYFDFILGNTDRHPGNWMVTEDGQRMKLIDNDMILPDYEMEKRDDLWGDVRISYMEENDWKVDRAKLDPWVKAAPKIQGYLKSNDFSQSVIDGFTSRLNYLVGAADVEASWSVVLSEFDTSRTGFSNRWGH